MKTEQQSLEQRTADARFLLSEAKEFADTVSTRCGDPKTFTMPSWEEWFRLVNAINHSLHVLD